MATWVLVYSFLVPNSPYFNNPVIMDNFATKEHCEIALDYVDTTYKESGIKGSGYCWGEQK
jgi:hypothetical protein